MTTTLFLILLTTFATISGLITEGAKNIISDKANIPSNILALIVALIVGGCGTAIYYQLNDIVFSMNNIIYMILMGSASGLVSMVGFDKVKQALEQIMNK